MKDVTWVPDLADVFQVSASLRVLGDLTADEDVQVNGLVDGRIDLGGHTLTVGPEGTVQGEVFAAHVMVLGKVDGDIVASSRVEMGPTACVTARIRAPRVVLADGAWFKGRIDAQASAQGELGEAEGSLEPSTASGA